MRRIILGMVSALFLGAPVTGQAETLIVDYYTLLSGADAYNSRGVPLDDLCTIVQQDRANWHRFFKRDSSDNGDYFFDSTAKRAMIAGKCQYDRGYFANPGVRIRNGTRSFYVYVQVFGNYGNVSRVIISEGAG
jgi:hypothetical protein